jgi:hypothetical protein
MSSIDVKGAVKPGERVAVPVGSRGIANMAKIVRAIVDYLKTVGAKPFIIPAMGSHGGGTPEGQTELLTSYGITEQSMDVPLLASMEVVEIGVTEDGFRVYLDRHASEADRILVVNRVKPHTGFIGPYQSGLMKMLLIGLGKHIGAISYHTAAVHMPFERLIRTAGQMVLERCEIVGGLAILENGYDQTSDIVGVKPESFLEEEPELLARVSEMVPGVPLEGLDLLIIDQMGKDLSGAGMDTNVIRRKRWIGQEGDQDEVDEAGAPKRIYVRDLSEPSHGNAAGIGLADFTSERLVAQMDREKTYINCLSSAHARGAMIPVVCPNDRQAIEWSFLSSGVVDPTKARIARISDTLHLATLEASPQALESISAGADLTELTTAREIEFDDDGHFVPFFIADQ